MKKQSKLFIILLGVLFLESIVMAFLHNTFLEAFIIGLPALVIPIYFMKISEDSNLTKHAAALSTMIFACLHIHQMNGLIEVHFEIFILMAFLIIFSDWKVFISALVLVAVHHLSFYYLQINNVGVYIFDNDRLMFSTVLIHAAYAIVESIIAAYIAKMLHDDSAVGKELSIITQSLTTNNESIDLNIRTKETDNIILNGFNQLLQMLNNVITDVKQQSQELVINSNNLSGVKEALENSADSRQQETDTIASSVEEMSVTVASIAQDTSMLSEYMRNANDKTQETESYITEINNNNNVLSDALNNTGKEIEELAKSSEVITTVLSEITSIADQTNLLALNAAIEAARAGEQGRGFAVVADEVRALANRTKDSTDRIGSTISELRNYSKKSTDSMNNCISVVEEVKETAVKATNQMNETSILVSKASDVSISVAAAVEEQSVTTSGIAESTEKMKVSSENDMSQIQSLTKEADNITVTVNSLESSIASFK